MTESPIHPQGDLHEDQKPQDGGKKKMTPTGRRRLCDFCGNTVALLYCRADSAKLCISCDRQVHSTNQLFTKHARSLLCDACDSSPASIFCSTENSVLCQNCDWERHNLCLSPLHDRRPLEGYTGCPSVYEFLAFVGLEDLGKKKELVNNSDDGFLGLIDWNSLNSPDDSLADLNLFVWETPSIVSLDDLMFVNDKPSAKSFQAMGVPPLPKNRNAACGQYKEEMLSQLREMTTLEPNLDIGNKDVDFLVEFQPLTTEDSIRQGHTCASTEPNLEPVVVPSYEANVFQWCNDAGEVADQGVPSYALAGGGGSYDDEKNHMVPNKCSNVVDNLSDSNGCLHEGQSMHHVSIETIQAHSRVAARELNSQERETVISRYKEKKKTRRYDKHVRYESRKVRAENRTRIKGRFAKMVDHH